jgi:hypothetical protein
MHRVAVSNVKSNKGHAIFEALEDRQLMAGVNQDIGTLNGRFFRQGSVFGSDTDAYHFELPRAGKIQVQLSRQIGTGSIVLRDAGGNALASKSASSNDRAINFDAPAGDYQLDVRADQAQFAPADFYTLAIAADFAGNTQIANSFNFSTSGARNLGTIADVDGKIFRDFVGFLDTNDHSAKDLVDVFRFDVPVSGDGSIEIKNVTSDPADGGALNKPNINLFQDRNNDGVLTPDEGFRGGPFGSVVGNIVQGRHYLVVGAPNVFQTVATGGLFPQKIGGTNYTLDINYNHSDLGRNTLATAFDFDVVEDPFVERDLLSSHDTTDIFKFNVANPGPFNFNAAITELTGNVNLQIDLVRDTNNDGVADSLPINLLNPSRNITPVAPNVGGLIGPVRNISRVLTDAGTYFLRVKRISGEGSYKITMSAVSTDIAGSTLATAKNLGALSTTRTASDFVGNIDSADIYRVSASQLGSIRLDVTGVNSGDVRVEVIRDTNNNGQINASEILASRTGNVLDGVVLPATGNYFVRVKPGPSNRDVNYNLAVSLSAQTPFNTTPILIGTGETRIEAENFDNGGEGVAFHDTDAADGPQNGVSFRSDTGVDLRTTNDSLGGNFRLATTKAGEFLEYTVNNTQDGLFNFDFRVSSPGNGASFHLEVDGTNVTGPVIIPNTGGVDNMTTIPSGLSNVALSAGPHVFRIVFDNQTGGNPDIAGTMNFFTVRRV